MTPTEIPDEVRSAGPNAALDEALARLANRTPEQKLADREKLMRTARKARPLPEGKTFFEVVQGTWPGDETDEQILKALDELS
ncbi:MAG: hypothetical protein KF873_01690 [Gemmataceae bacterium]|nr:hypothetical protein [Planctomycetia bacterium]MBX3397428.1 hypothetical protein [Gemmataceae bacterium]